MHTSSHCDACRRTNLRLLYKRRFIYREAMKAAEKSSTSGGKTEAGEGAQTELLSWRYLLNKKAGGEGGHFESCITSNTTLKACACEGKVRPRADVTLCNEANIVLNSDEGGGDASADADGDGHADYTGNVDSTEMGKIYSQLTSKVKDEEGEEKSIYEYIFLRAGELEQEPHFAEMSKEHGHAGKLVDSMARQICHETGCGCSDQH